jgi:hypothetical protein
VQRRQVYTVENEENTGRPTEFESILFEMITIADVREKAQKTSKDEVSVKININIPRKDNLKTILKAKLDTGAQGNILPLRLYSTIYPQDIDENSKPKSGALKKSDIVLAAYGGPHVKHYGIATIPCDFKRNNTIRFCHSPTSSI